MVTRCSYIHTMTIRIAMTKTEKNACLTRYAQGLCSK